MLTPYQGRRRTYAGTVARAAEGALAVGTFLGKKRGAAVMGGIAAGIEAGKEAYRNWKSSKQNSSKRRKVASATKETFQGRRVVRSRRSRRRGKKVPLRKRVFRLERHAQLDDSSIDYRKTYFSGIGSSQSQQAWSFFAIETSIIQTAMDQFRFYDSNTNAFEQKDPETLTQKAQYLVSNWQIYGEIVNNYQVPVDVKVHYLRCKDNTSLTPLDILDADITDKFLNFTDRNNMNINLSEGAQLGEYWGKVKGSTSTRLLPGQSMKVGMNRKPFMYDPSENDKSGQTYVVTARPMGLLIQVRGVLGHDTAAAEFGLLAAKVDYKLTVRCKVHYNSGGAQFKKIYIDNDADAAWTNGGVVSSMPVADNIQYSVA